MVTCFPVSAICCDDTRISSYVSFDYSPDYASVIAMATTKTMKLTPTTGLILPLFMASMSLGQVSLAAADDASAQPSAAVDSVATAPGLMSASKISAGRYERLNLAGETVADGEPWSCVADKRTGLIWEVKTRDGGMRDSAHSYTWFDPALESGNGVEDGGRCSGRAKCDTHHYRIRLNQARLCGFDDWRLPAREELETLVKFKAKKSATAIDERFFPGTAASWYWTAASNLGNPDYAWYVLFRNGISLNDLKARPKHVRLVRGGKLPVASNP